MLVVDQLVLRSVSSYIDVPLTEPRVLVVEGALLFFCISAHPVVNVAVCGECFLSLLALVIHSRPLHPIRIV